MSLNLRLQHTTHDLHREIEQLPLSRWMVEGTVPLTVYASLLRQLGYIHRTLESALAEQRDASTVLQPHHRRAPLIERDLIILGMNAWEPPLPMVAALLVEIESWSGTKPWMLTGCLYVLEGSRMGSMMLVKPLAQALRVPLAPHCGLDYHLEDMRDGPHHWRQFKGRLDALSLPPVQSEELIQAAVRMFEVLIELYEVLSQTDAAETSWAALREMS
ncbi:MAG: biliverdin-producing heme oxygenase [Gemmataceae bacterium]